MLKDSTENRLIGNKITEGNQECVVLWGSSNNRIESNLMSGGNCGVEFSEAYDNVIVSNVINHTIYGIEIDHSYRNSIYHNNFINKWIALAYLFSYPGSNYLDNGLEGNYWGDYNGTDSNYDGLGDTPYVLDENNTDHYPLMGTFQSFNVSITPQSFGEVDVISNFTISEVGLYEWLTTPNQYLQAGQPFLRLLPVQEQNMTAGFCRMTLPNNILNTSEYIVLINMTPVIANKLAISNDTQTTLYFTFDSSALDGIIIVPEFTLFLVIPIFMIAALLAIILYKRRYMTRAL
jgi:parallel beta-helix repeat protein